MASAAALSKVPLVVAARAIGSWCWVEQKLFEILGSWSVATSDDAVALMLAEHSRHHAWRAERWAEVLPGAYVADPQILLAPPADAAFVNGLESFETTPDRLAGVYRVLLPTLGDTYAASASRMNSVTDRHLMRTLRVVEGDLRHDLQEAQPLLAAHPGVTSDLDPSSQLGRYTRNLQVRPAVAWDLGAALQCWGS